MMLELPLVLLATPFVRLVLTQLHVPLVSPKTTEPSSMDNVCVPVDSINLSMPPMQSPASHAVLNVKNVQVPLSVKTVMPTKTELSDMMKSDTKLVTVLQDIPHFPMETVNNLAVPLILSVKNAIPPET
jgi:hypothetical protein